MDFFKCNSMMKRLLTSAVFFALLLLATGTQAADGGRYYYTIRVYHYATEQQGARLDSFLQKAYLPALHRNGVAKVGVYKPATADSLGLRTYVFVPYKSLAQFEKINATLEADPKFAHDGAGFIDAAYNDAPFSRYETALIQAFANATSPGMPALTGPKEERIYELRSYEGPTDGLFANKVQMFNKGDEIGIFSRLGFNAVFYGSVVAGAHMPNLMYMTSFENKASRDEHWKAFGSDAYWKKLSADPRYQHNVSHQDILLLHPTAYSEY